MHGGGVRGTGIEPGVAPGSLHEGDAKGQKGHDG